MTRGQNSPYSFTVSTPLPDSEIGQLLHESKLITPHHFMHKHGKNAPIVGYILIGWAPESFRRDEICTEWAYAGFFLVE